MPSRYLGGGLGSAITHSSGSVEMLTKCSNPPCSASFQSLDDGKLFRLEPDGVLRTGEPKRIEYYWLCERCASTMTLRLGDHDKVIAVALPAPLQGVPDNVPGG